MAKPRENLVLVGFGDENLTDLIEKLGTEKEEELLQVPLNAIPRYRHESTCTQEEIKAFVKFGTFLYKKLQRGEI